MLNLTRTSTDCATLLVGDHVFDRVGYIAAARLGTLVALVIINWCSPTATVNTLDHSLSLQFVITGHFLYVVVMECIVPQQMGSRSLRNDAAIRTHEWLFTWQ